MLKHFSFCALIFLAACSGNESTSENGIETETVPVVVPPFENDFANKTVFMINPAEQNTLEAANGSSLTVPANILVDANGELITSEVTLVFDQYHSAVDVLASGIPMEYDSLGESYTFKTAGMFKLEASSKNEPVFVKDGKSIQVNLASDKSEEEPFNFYSLNESTGDWTFEHNNSPITNNPKFKPAAYLPQKPEEVSEDAFILDINFDQSNFAELADFNGIVWEYSGNADSLDPRKSETFKKSKFTTVDLTPTYNAPFEYYITFSSDKAKFTTCAKAALSGDDLDLALKGFEAKKKEILKKMDDIQKPYIRSVSIGGFGTYNYDYIYHLEEPAQLIANFDFGDQNHLKDKAMVAVVYEDKAAVVNYPVENWPKFGLDTKANPKVIAILPDNKIAIYPENISDCYSKTEHTFKMKVLDKKVESKADLIDALAGM